MRNGTEQNSYSKNSPCSSILCPIHTNLYDNKVKHSSNSKTATYLRSILRLIEHLEKHAISDVQSAQINALMVV